MIQEAQLTRGDDSYFLVEDDDEEDVEPEVHEEEEVSTAEKCTWKFYGCGTTAANQLLTQTRF